MVSLAGTTLVLTGKESRSHAAISPGKPHCVRPGFLGGLCSCRRTTGGFLDSIYVTIHRASKTPLRMGRTSCTATEMCPQSKICRKKSNTGRDELKVCMKGLHTFKLVPKHSFASPKLSPQLSSKLSFTTAPDLPHKAHCALLQGYRWKDCMKQYQKHLTSHPPLCNVISTKFHRWKKNTSFYFLFKQPCLPSRNFLYTWLKHVILKLELTSKQLNQSTSFQMKLEVSNIKLKTSAFVQEICMQAILEHKESKQSCSEHNPVIFFVINSSRMRPWVIKSNVLWFFLII